MEEEAKRRTLLRYVHSVKEHATSAAEAARLSGKTENQLNAGTLQLPESGIGDEEVHALAALLRGNKNVTELNLISNQVTDEGALALGAVLAGTCGLRTIDLRENKIGKNGIRGLAEALERAERVRHVYVHAGGKIEALGTGMWAAPRDGGDDDQGATPTVTVETVCVLDVRDNDSNSRHEPMLDDTMGGASNPVSVPETRGRGGRDSSKKWAEKSSSNNKGSKTRRVKEVGSSKKGKRSQTAPSNKRSKDAKEKRQKRQRELVERRMEKQRIKRENKKKEDGWQGRAGGMSAKSPHKKRTHTRKTIW